MLRTLLALWYSANYCDEVELFPFSEILNDADLHNKAVGYVA